MRLSDGRGAILSTNTTYRRRHARITCAAAAGPISFIDAHFAVKRAREWPTVDYVGGSSSAFERALPVMEFLRKTAGQPGRTVRQNEPRCVTQIAIASGPSLRVGALQFPSEAGLDGAMWSSDQQVRWHWQMATRYRHAMINSTRFRRRLDSPRIWDLSALGQRIDAILHVRAVDLL